jgi:hypothetical protein
VNFYPEVMPSATLQFHMPSPCRNTAGVIEIHQDR